MKVIFEMVTKYLARLEMSNSQIVDYDLVHHAMECSALYRTDVGPDGVEKPLPRATYVCEGDWTLQEVADKIRLAIASTPYTATYVVTVAENMIRDSIG